MFLIGPDRSIAKPQDMRAARVASIIGQKDLELLWALMRRAVILSGRQQTRVVGEIEALRQRRDKLVGGKTTERAIFRRHDDVKTPRGRSDERFLFETVQRELGGNG